MRAGRQWSSRRPVPQSLRPLPGLLKSNGIVEDDRTATAVCKFNEGVPEVSPRLSIVCCVFIEWIGKTGVVDWRRLS
jgi:hypothetical protein